ncbi:S41 family peptidase [Ekhidna sp.]
MRSLKTVLLICLPLLCASQNYTTDDIQLVSELDRLFKENHIEYDSIILKLDDRFAKQLLFELDPDSRFFTQDDVLKIQDELANFSLNQNYTRDRLGNLRQLFQASLENTKALLNTINNIDFLADDSVYLGTQFDSVRYAKNNEELRWRWIRYFKFNVLLKSEEDSLLTKGTASEINSDLNKRIRTHVESSLCYIEQLSEEKSLSNYVYKAYLNAYCNSFDPHSSVYLNQEEKLFQSSLSSESYGTGIMVGRDGNQLYITEIIPFSNASYNEDIHVGDEITRIRIVDDLVTPTCISDETLTEFFYGDRNTTIEIEVKSQSDYKYRTAKLTKGVVNNSVNHTYSYLLNNENIKVGYVQFPSFYARYTKNGRSASEDLALILLAFKKQNIDGVILDLRSNGGGSTVEAADVLGYFIDYGPLFTIVDDETPEGRLIKDTKRGKVIDTNLIILVDALSASASELVAATMQKYPNTLIVGAQTFGKATGQIVLPLKTKYAKENQGSVAITHIKSYRFDGSNYQGHGVIPDIQLPFILTKRIVGENNYDYILNFDKKRSFRQVKFRDEPIDTLRYLSKERDLLSEVSAISKSMETKLLKGLGVSLNYENFKNPYTDLQEYSIDSHNTFVIESMEQDEAFEEESDRIKNNKQKDLVLKEVFLIFEDWMNIKNSN